MAEFKVTNTEIAALTSVFSLMMAASAILVGWLFMAHGNRKTALILAVVLFSVAAMMGGFATSFAALIVVRVLMGLTEGPVFPFAQSILVQESSPHRRAFNNSMTQTFGGMLVGAFIAPILLGYLAESYGWRASLIIIGAPGLVLAVALMLLLKHRPLATTQSAQAVSPQVTIPQAAGRNIFLCVVIGMGLISWLILQGIFVPLYLMNAQGYSVSQMTQVMAMSGLGGLLGAVTISLLADRIGRKPALLLACALALISPLGALYLSDNIGLLMAATGLGWFGAGACGLFMATIPAESTPPAQHPRVMGLVLGVPEVFGGVLMPLVAGYLADRYGLEAVLWLCLASPIVAGIFTFFLFETRNLQGATSPKEQ